MCVGESRRGRKKRGTREGENPRKCMAEIARLYGKEKLGRGKGTKWDGKKEKGKEGSGEVLGRKQGQEMMRARSLQQAHAILKGSDNQLRLWYVNQAP